MKISLFVPHNNFLEELEGELTKLGHEVLKNKCTGGSDVILITSSSVLHAGHEVRRDFPNIPLITYNWDWYDHLDKTTGYWPQWIDLMRMSFEVWSASEITAKKCEKDTGIKSPHWMYAYILPDEWIGEATDGGYIMQASRDDAYKRFAWFKEAACENNIPHKAYHPNQNIRPDYINAIQNCSFLCVCSEEESLGTLSAMEASFNAKPVLISDFEGAKETWEDDVWYFKKDSLDDLKAKMKWLWDNKDTKEVKEKAKRAQKKVQERFLPQHFAKLIDERLKKIL